MQVWSLLGAVPVGWKTPSLNADSSTVALEELVLAYEGLRVKHKQPGNAALLQSGGAKHNALKRDPQGYYPDSE
jgi:hypothetical protein